MIQESQLARRRATINNIVKKQLWIGLVSFLPSDWSDEFDGLKGAFVNAIAPAFDEDDFVRQVSAAAKELGLEIEEVKNFEPYLDRMRNFEVAEELRDVAKQAELDKNVGFGTFHTYDIKTN